MEKVELCNNGKYKRVRMGEERHFDKEALLPTLSAVDDIVIHHTEERIRQELDNLSASELKASIIVGVVPTIFGLLVSFRLDFFTNAIKNPSIESTLPIFIILGFLVAAFVFALKVIIPRERLWLWKPRESNNHYSNMNDISVKKELKEELIQNFEIIAASRQKDARHIIVGYFCLIIGSAGIFITFLILSIFGKL